MNDLERGTSASGGAGQPAPAWPSGARLTLEHLNALRAASGEPPTGGGGYVQEALAQPQRQDRYVLTLRLDNPLTADGTVNWSVHREWLQTLREYVALLERALQEHECAEGNPMMYLGARGTLLTVNQTTLFEGEEFPGIGEAAHARLDPIS